jgi:hypothetical protein
MSKNNEKFKWAGLFGELLSSGIWLSGSFWRGVLAGILSVKYGGLKIQNSAEYNTHAKF